MAAIKLQKFLGIAPKISPELLPAGVGQTAHNVKLYSGDLIPYRTPLLVDSAERVGDIQTLYALRNGTAPVWLTWLTDVDIVVASDSSDDEQRIYYTGDGSAKVTTYDLATTGSEPYPLAYYDLGLALPTVTATSTAIDFSTLTSVSYARDAGNTAIITTAAHGLRTGNVVTVRDFSGTIPESFNVVNTRITVTSTTTFEYYSAGDVVSVVADTNGRVDMAGGTVTRDYVYTWYTPWGEESIGSTPSETLYIKEGESVVVGSLPTAAPSGDNFISALRLYRTYTGTAGTEFYRLSTLWFPQVTANVALTSNVATVTMATHHGFIVGDRFKLFGCTDSTFDITDGEVTVVDNDTTFSYALVNSNITSVADTTGLLYHDVAELATDDARYWGDNLGTSLRERTTNVSTMTTAVAHGLSSGMIVTVSGMTDATFDEANVVITVTSTTAFTYPNSGSNAGSASDVGGLVTSDSFFDDFDASNLINPLVTDDYDAPHADMIGITVAQNAMVCGFFDNQLCFAEPGAIHAWPEKYRQTFEHNIVAVESIQGYILVLTDEYAYRVSGGDPATLAISRIDTLYPCLSKRSVVNMGYGVVYSSHGGLSMWSPSIGIAIATNFVYDWDTWDTAFDPSSIKGTYYNDKYFASHSTGSFIFERDDKIGGFFVTINELYNATWLDPLDDKLYYVPDASGNIYEFDPQSGATATGEWKSKVVVTKDYINLGAARIIGDFPVSAEENAIITAYNATIPTNNAVTWAVSEQIGGINGPTDYMDGAVAVTNNGEVNTMPINGDAMLLQRRSIPSANAVTVQLWQDKTLVYTGSVTDDSIFRLPSGYKSDTFEISVSGAARIRAIHLGETPDGLRKA